MSNRPVTFDRELIVPTGATAPTTASNGMLWLDTSASVPLLKVYYSGAWHTIGAAYS